MEASKCWKMFEFQKISIKMKNCKTFYEAQTASCLKEIIQPPPNPQPIPYQTKSYYVFRTKIFLRRYTETYRHFLSKCFKNAILWRQEMVQLICFFWHQTEKCSWKICKVRKVFDCVSGAYYFQCQVSWVRLFERNCIVKWVIFFASSYC